MTVRQIRRGGRAHAGRVRCPRVGNGGIRDRERRSGEAEEQAGHPRDAEDPGARRHRQARGRSEVRRRRRKARPSKKATPIQTDEAGSAEINYTDGSLTRLAASTEYTITKLTNKQGGRQTQGTLTVGETWNRAAKVSENGSFEVKAGGTTAAVEGTAFVFSCVKSTKTNKKGKKTKQRPVRSSAWSTP